MNEEIIPSQSQDFESISDINLLKFKMAEMCNHHQAEMDKANLHTEKLIEQLNQERSNNRILKAKNDILIGEIKLHQALHDEASDLLSSAKSAYGSQIEKYCGIIEDLQCITRNIVVISKVNSTVSEV